MLKQNFDLISYPAAFFSFEFQVAFKQLDLDGNGKVSKDEFFQGLQKLGLGHVDFETVVSKFINDPTAEIDYFEFKKIFFGSI